MAREEKGVLVGKKKQKTWNGSVWESSLLTLWSTVTMGSMVITTPDTSKALEVFKCLAGVC